MILENFTSISAFISYSLWAYGPTLNGAPSKWMLLTSPMVLYCIIRYKLISSSKVSKSIYSISNQFIYESPEEIFIKDSHIKYSFLICFKHSFEFEFQFINLTTDIGAIRAVLIISLSSSRF